MKNKAEFQNYMDNILDIASHYDWHLAGTDIKSSRISLESADSSYRIDVYVPKWSLYFIQKGKGRSGQEWFKNQSIEKLEDLIRSV